MTRYLLLSALFIFPPLLSAAPTYQVLPQQVSKSPNDKRDYRAIELANKMQVLLISDPEAKNSAASVALPVGSMHNPDSQLGLAHYLEHMLFLGSERFPKINEYSSFMSLNGGFTNAYTAQDKTVYGFEINDAMFEQALDRSGDVLRAPLLDEKYADKERNTVNAEQETYKSQDGRKIYALGRYLLNPEHPMSRFSTGNLETLKDKPGSVLQDELQLFFNTYYSSNLMKGVLYSPRSLDEQAKLADKYFGQIPNRKTEKPVVLAKLATEKQLGIEAQIKPKADIKMLKVSFFTPGVREAYAYKPGQYISRILGSDREGSLSAYLQKQGLVESLMAGFSSSYGPQSSAFTVQFKLTEAGLEQQDRIMGALFSYIDLIKKEGVNQNQYEALKRTLDNSFEYLPQYAGFNYAMALSATMLNYPVTDLLDSPFRLDAFKPKLIKELLSYLTPEHGQIILAYPGAKGGIPLMGYDGSYSVSKIPAERLALWLKTAPTQALVLPEGNRWLAENQAIKKPEYQNEAVELVKEEGISLWFKQSAYFKEPKGSLSVQLNSDLLDHSVDSRIKMALLMEMLNKQLVGLKYEAGEANLSLGVNSNDGLLFSTSGFNDKQIPLLLVLMDRVKKAEFSPQELALAKVELKRRINNKSKAQSMSLMFQEFGALVRVPSWSDKSKLKALQEITLAQQSAFREQLFTQANIRMLVLGNFSSAEAIALSGEVKRRAKPVGGDFYYIGRIAPQAKRVLNLASKSDMGDAALGYFFISSEPGEQSIAQAELLNKLTHPEFYDQIRTQEQLSYSPFTAGFSVGEYGAFALVSQSPVQGPKYLEQRFTSFREAFAKTLADYGQKEFDEVKLAHIANYTKKPSNMGGEFSFLAGLWESGKQDINGKALRIKALEETQLKDVQAFYRNNVMGDDAEQILVQVRGSKFKDAPVAQIKNQLLVEDIDTYQQGLKQN